jgi:hypothetical protein
MNAAVARTKVESLLARRFDRVFERPERQPGELFPTGVADIDRCWYGLPRGAITEIHGSRSCGRTSLLLSVLSRATAQEETCALVDCSDTFDLLSATKAGVDFDRVLWVRCSNNLERGFKSVDLLLHGGGFGFIALLLGDVPAKAARRIISSWWFRFRRAVENTPTVLMVITPIACVRSCAALTLELKKDTAVWPGSLSLVSENSNGALTGKDHHLTLVRAPLAQSRPLSHSLWLQKISIHINRQRPVQWSDEACQFEPVLALTMFEDIR